jgi:hypothetical protein
MRGGQEALIPPSSLLNGLRIPPNTLIKIWNGGYGAENAVGWDALTPLRTFHHINSDAPSALKAPSLPPDGQCPDHLPRKVQGYAPGQRGVFHSLVQIVQ